MAATVGLSARQRATVEPCISSTVYQQLEIEVHVDLQYCIYYSTRIWLYTYIIQYSTAVRLSTCTAAIELPVLYYTMYGSIAYKLARRGRRAAPVRRRWNTAPCRSVNIVRRP